MKSHSSPMGRVQKVQSQPPTLKGGWAGTWDHSQGARDRLYTWRDLLSSVPRLRLILRHVTAEAIAVCMALRPSGDRDSQGRRRGVAVRFGALEGLETPRFSWAFRSLGT